ncbi:MAG: FAD-dependent thymidylate synthase [Chthonomonadales bacterium]
MEDEIVQQASGFPYIPSRVFRTRLGTPYLRAPGVHLIAKPEVSIEGLREFLEGFDVSLGFSTYLQDPDVLPPGAQLCKLAGQLCYMSFGPKRTPNARAGRYFDNIKESGHGSVLEHANYTFLFYGISRSVTHELVRHRAGFGFSQVSQRYVSGRVLRFVERPEYAQEEDLHALFEARIDRAYQEYTDLAEALLKRQKEGSAILSAEAKTDLRKKVQQAARSLLPNETEAPITVTANARAWRHFIEMRANPHAEIEIRTLAFRTYQCLSQIDPYLFGDYDVLELPDGTYAVKTSWPKV